MGKNGLLNMLTTLVMKIKSQVSFGHSNHIYSFGDGRKIESIHSAKIPAIIGSYKFDIVTDVVDSDIPLFFLKSPTKRAIMKLNFQDDTITIFNENILITTQNRHYAIPITNMSTTLTSSDSKDNHTISLKLHRQFTHPSKEKFLQLTKKAGKPWCNNQNLMEEINNVSSYCRTCKLYKKTPPIPIVGLPMAKEFQETVAMDLKFYNGKILVHLVDHSTRLSASSFIPDKNPDTNLTYIFKIWILVYWCPRNIFNSWWWRIH